MREYQYRKIDAFTSGDSMGNPAACIYLQKDQTLTDAEMLEIARRHKGFVSEVVYCKPLSATSYGMTYYSSECEVDFCGHATVACAYNLIQETSYLADQETIEIHTNKKGTLTVHNQIAEQDSVYVVAPAPQKIDTKLDINAVAKILDLRFGQISETRPIDVIDAGLKTLIVPMTSLQDEIELAPNEKRLKSFCLKNDLDIVLTYSLETDDPKSIAHTRVFAPKFGYLEDPATGSGNNALGYYMLENNLWDGTNGFIEQGGTYGAFNIVKLSVENERILFGGKASLRIKGVYYL